MKKSCIAALGLVVAGLPLAGPAGAADWMTAPDIKRELVDTELAFRGLLPHPPRWLRLSHRPGLPADAAGVLRGVPPPF
jgi:hypothetical protein